MKIPEGKIIDEIRAELSVLSDDTLRQSTQNFFKEKIQCYGIKTETVRKLGTAFFKKLKNLSKDEILALCDSLFQSGMLEESIIACNWSYLLHNDYTPSDFEIFEKWVGQYISNWASCDTLCNHTIGDFIQLYPEYMKRLKKWATSENRWMRRASAVTLIIPAKNGMFLDDVFEIAGKLLLGPDDLVQKGYGWMLKSAAALHQEDVFNFIMKHKSQMPRTSLRYAIEKMPPELRKKAMEN